MSSGVVRIAAIARAGEKGLTLAKTRVGDSFGRQADVELDAERQSDLLVEEPPERAERRVPRGG